MNKIFYQSPSFVEDITTSRLIWAGYTWSKEGSLLRTVLENAPTRKNTTGTLNIKMGRLDKRGRGKSKTRRGPKGMIIR